MPDHVITSNRSTSLTVVGGDDYLLLQGVTHYSTTFSPVYFNAVALTRSEFRILGDLVSTAGIALNALDSDSSRVTVTVGSQGSILGASTSRGVYIGTGEALVQNDGLIGGTAAVDFASTVLNATLTNTGLIQQTDPSTADSAVRSAADTLAITNSGQITGQNAIVTYGATDIQNSGIIDAFIVAIRHLAGASDLLRVVNSGTITSESYAIQDVNGTPMVLNNSGTILGSIASNGNATLVNTGTVQGSILLGDATDIVVNGGTIQGNIELEGGVDIYDGTGTLLGHVDGGDGNDTLAGGHAADALFGGADQDKLIGRAGDDLLKGEAGFDFLIGGDGNDSLDGGTNDDTLLGNAGDDSLLGDFGNDLLVGQDGDDELAGSAGADLLDGGNGNDILEGGADNDTLRGRAGEDELAGGTGLDFLTGGGEADLFIFRSIAEAGIGATRDQILDFEQGVDTIVIAGLSPGVFEFRGTAGFAPSGNPEIRMNETATGSTIVQIDNNGDGVIDAEIRVANVTGLTAADFVL